MKWTKFKDDLPKLNAIYITDFDEVWIATKLTGSSWKTCNPNYAWAEVPIPEVPKQPKEEHLCQPYPYIAESVKCISKNGKLEVYFDSQMWLECKFCPFCGYSIKEKQ